MENDGQPEHSLKGKWFVHYYVDRPFLSIMDLPEDEARALQGNKTAGVCPETGKDIYFQKRRLVEDWDRTAHLARGGRVDNLNPIYAFLTDSPDLYEGTCVKIPADSISEDFISLSYGDSFPNFDVANTEDALSRVKVLGRTYTPREFFQHSSGRLPVTFPEKNEFVAEESFYVEARIYTRNISERGP